MCNAHFQHLFDDASLPSSSASPSTFAAAGIAHQQHPPGPSNRSQLAMHPHDASAVGHESPMTTLSPVSAGGWSYAMDTQSDVQMYSPASTASYSGFHSPIEANTRAYALAGALQQQPGAAYPESSQRSTELSRGAPSQGQGQAPTAAPTPAFGFPETQTQQQVTPQPQRWAYPGHAHDFAQEALSMARAPIMDHPAAHAPHPPSASDEGVNSGPQRDGRGRVPPLFGTQNMPAGGPRINIVAGPGTTTGAPAAGDQRAQAGTRQAQHQGMSARAYPQLRQNHHHHRAMASQSQQQQQQQQWLSQAQQQQMDNGASFLQMPTPRSVNGAHQGGLRNYFPYAAGGANAGEFEYDLESDDFGGDEEFDDEEDGPASHLHLGIPPPASPTPELQFPQGVSGTPSDLIRANFNLYGTNTTNWPTEHLGGLAGGNNGMGSLMDPGAGQGSGLPGSSSPRSNGSKGKAISSMPPSEFFRQAEKREKGKRAEESEGQTVKVLIESATPGEPPKKVKMHQCRICQKLFPRPSGLATHMNSHSGARPFKCPLALCPKTFAVRSNARRHLRTHGITVPPNALNKNGQGRHQEEPFHVGFETPVIIDVQDPSAGGTAGDGAGHSGHGRPPKLRWVPPSLATRANAPRLRSLSPTSDMADIDGQDVSMVPNGGGHVDLGLDAMMLGRRAPGLRIAPAPLPPALPSGEEGAADLNARFDERNSYSEAGTYPYHPDQWRCLPGPGLVLALRS